MKQNEKVAFLLLWIGITFLSFCFLFTEQLIESMSIELFQKGIWNTLTLILSISGTLVLYPTLTSLFERITGSKTIVLYDIDWGLNYHPEDASNTELTEEK